MTASQTAALAGTWLGPLVWSAPSATPVAASTTIPTARAGMDAAWNRPVIRPTIVAS
jgi:hypothetical protein